jgi:hypothetical protein
MRLKPPPLTFNSEKAEFNISLSPQEMNCKGEKAFMFKFQKSLGLDVCKSMVESRKQRC